MECRLATFLEYQNQRENSSFSSGVRVHLSPIQSHSWTKCMDDMDHHDSSKTSSSGVHALSTDSLNIHTDEKMPAKGEISEQESNGDIDGSWSHQVRVFKTSISFKVITARKQF